MNVTPGLVDSHCHIDFPELAQDIDGVLNRMAMNGVTHALCVSVSLEDFPRVFELAQARENIYASVGVHPDYQGGMEPSCAELVRLGGAERIVAIGETGLDYYRLTGNLEWQRDRFRTHIRAARALGKPLIIHCRDSAEDVLRIMQEEGAAEVGGVMHCFTESWSVAERALALNFLISFSGIVTFRNAGHIRAVAERVPADRLLLETDAPYLAPVPKRGKTNEPSYVRHVGECVAQLRGVSFAEIAQRTTANFFELFNAART